MKLCETVLQAHAHSQVRRTNHSPAQANLLNKHYLGLIWDGLGVSGCNFRRMFNDFRGILKIWEVEHSRIKVSVNNAAIKTKPRGSEAMAMLDPSQNPVDPD